MPFVCCYSIYGTDKKGGFAFCLIFTVCMGVIKSGFDVCLLFTVFMGEIKTNLPFVCCLQFLSKIATTFVIIINPKIDIKIRFSIYYLTM